MVLTFEKIRDFYWKEKNSHNLQPIPKGFYSEISPYMLGKDEIIKNVINDIIDRREAKILNIALSSLKSSSYAKPSNMSDEEEHLLEQILGSMRLFKAGISGASAQAPQKTEPDKMQEEKKEPESDGFVIVKENIPSFIGNDMKTYHLKKGDRVYLPDDLKRLLLERGICEHAK